MNLKWLILVLILASCSPKIKYRVLEKMSPTKKDKCQYYCKKLGSDYRDLFWLDCRHKPDDIVWQKDKE